MTLEIDHAFILVDAPDKVGELLVEFGLEESFSRDHPGQGTSNRRFTFANGMLELLWLRDKDEAINGPGKGLQFCSRCNEATASPFGLVVNRTQDVDSLTSEKEMPFEGWEYQPDYFKAPMAFYVGENAKDVSEPLCIYVPFMAPPQRPVDEGMFRTLSQITVHTAKPNLSRVLSKLNHADRLRILSSDQHLMELTLDKNRQCKSKDFRPDIPLVIHY